MKTIRHIFLLALLVSLFQAAFSQSNSTPVYEYPYVKYTVKDGLSQSQVTDVFQDSKGFIWVATKVGVNRFDGLAFENYKTNPIFPKDYVEQIDEDQNGNVWMAGRNGLYCYDGKTVKNYLPDSLIGNIKLRGIALTSAGVWFTETNSTKLYLLDVKKKEIENMTQSLAHDIRPARLNSVDSSRFFISGQKVAKKGSVSYLIENNELSKKFEGHNIFYRNPANELFVYLDNNLLFQMKADSMYLISKFNLSVEVARSFAVNKGNAIFRDFNNDYFVNLETKESTTYNFSIPTSVIFDRQGYAWFGTEEGLYKFTSDAFIVYPESRGMLDKVWDFLEDKDGNIWFMSFGDGLSYLQGNGQYVKSSGYEKFIGFKDFFGFYMNGIKKENGDLLFPSGAAVLKYSNDKFSVFHKDSLSHYQSLYEGHDKTIYIGCNGLIAINSNGSKTYYGEEQGLGINQLQYIVTMLQDTSGIVWLGSDNGLAKFDGENFSNYYLNGGFGLAVHSLLRDKKENIWFGTSNGLYFYNYKGELPQPIGKKQFNETVKFLEETDNGWLVVGCIDKLLLFDLKRFYNDGVAVFHEMNEEDGFTGIDCRWNGSFKDSNGHVWIATSNKVIKMLPEKLSISEPDPNVYISDTRYLESEMDSQIVSYYPIDGAMPELSITTSDQNLEINFFSIEHQYPEKVKYQYRLIGQDTTWSLPYAARYVSYTSLKKGKYTFEVRACIKGKCSDSKSLLIKVKPSRLFERNWFWGVVFLIAIGLIIYSIYLKLKNNENERNSLRLQVNNLKLKAKLSQNKVSPHFTFNVLSHISEMILMKENKNAYKYLSLFVDVVRPIFSKQSNITHKLEKELNLTKDYLELEKLRFDNKFDVEITISDEKLLDREVPQTIIQTFANNAVKHGIEPKKGRGKISIKIEEVNEYLILTIADDGIGLDESRKRKKEIESNIPSGNGLGIIDEILNYLNHRYNTKNFYMVSDVSDQDPFASGTVAKVKIYSHLENE